MSKLVIFLLYPSPQLSIPLIDFLSQLLISSAFNYDVLLFIVDFSGVSFDLPVLLLSVDCLCIFILVILLLFCLLRSTDCIFGLVIIFEIISFGLIFILFFQGDFFHLPKFCALLWVPNIFLLWPWVLILIWKECHNFEREPFCHIKPEQLNSFFLQLSLLIL